MNIINRVGVVKHLQSLLACTQPQTCCSPRAVLFPSFLAGRNNPSLNNQQHLTTLVRSACVALQSYPMPTQAALSQALTEAGILEADVPVVFLHGIGGLPAYLELLQYLEAEGSPLLAVEVKSVAMRMG